MDETAKPSFESQTPLLSQTQLAEMTGKDRRTIKARLAGLEPVERKGQALLYDSREALAAIYKIEVERHDVAREMLIDEARKLKAEAQIKEIQAARDASEVITIEDVAEVVGAEYTAIRAILVAIPTKLCQELAMLDDVAQVKAKLDDAINEALTEMSGDLKYYVEAENTVISPLSESEGN